MSWESKEPIVQVLHTIGNPIRKAAIEALREEGMRFSQLLASCGLDYDHDASHFYYHLSKLVNRRIVKKVDDKYCLTKFGSQIADVLDSLEKECFFLLKEKEDIGGENVKEENITVNWLSWSDFIHLLGKDVRDEEEKLPQSEKEKLEKFKAWSFPTENKRYYHPRILAAKKNDEILGFVETVGAITSMGSMFANRLLIKRILMTSPRPHQRKKIAQFLLTDLLKEAEEHGVTSIEAININAEDEELLTVFKRLDFERTSVGYNLRKEYGEEPFEFVPTIG